MRPTSTSLARIQRFTKDAFPDRIQRITAVEPKGEPCVPVTGVTDFGPCHPTVLGRRQEVSATHKEQRKEGMRPSISQGSGTQPKCSNEKPLNQAFILAGAGLRELTKQYQSTQSPAIEGSVS